METPSQLNRFRSAVQQIIDTRVQTSGTGTDADTMNLDTPTTQSKKMQKARTLDVLPLEESPRTNRPRTKTTLARLFTTFLGKQDSSVAPEPVTPPSPQGRTNKLQSLVKSFIKTNKKTLPVVPKALGPEGCRKKFFRAFQILRILHRLNRISEDIQLYGTSSNLFDLTTRERTRVKKILYPSVLDETEEQLNEEKGMKWYVIHPKSRIRLVWSFVILFVLTYTATITPYRLTFDDTSSTFWTVVDYCVDLLFLVDLVMNFVSAYYDEEGKLVKDPSTLIKRYLKSWFIVDLLAVFPFDLVQSIFMDDGFFSESQTNFNTFVRLFRLPRLYKVVRIMRINNIFKFLRGTPFLEWLELHSVFVRLFSFFVIVVTGMHIAACIWYFAAKLDGDNPNTWLARGNLNNKSNFSVYITSLYYIFTTLATVGYGDVHSATVAEKVLSLALMILGVAFYSFTIGLIASTLSSRENRESSLKRKISIANEFSDEIKAPRALKSKIAKILEYNSYRNCFSWADKKEIFGEIPISLRYEIVMTMHNEILKSIPFFREHSDKYFVVTIAEVLKPLRVKPRDYLWKEGDSAESMYFLIAGKVHLISSEFLTPDDRVNNQKTSIIFKRFMSGSYFGEIELIYKRERKYSLQASSEAELFYLTKHDYFNVLVREFPHIHEEFKEIALERDRRNIDSLIEIKNFLEAHIPDDGRRATTIMATKLNTKIITKEINSKQSLEPMSTTSIEAFPTFTNINLAPGGEQIAEEDEPATSVFPQLKINNLFPKNVPIQNRRRALDVDSEIRKLSTFHSNFADGGPISLLGKIHKKAAKKGQSNSSSGSAASNSLSNILEKSDHSGSSSDDSSSDSDSSSSSNSQSQSQSESQSEVSISKEAAAKMNSKINIGPPNSFTNYDPPKVYSFPATQYFRSKSSSFLKTLQGGTPKSQNELLRRASTQKYKRRSREKSLLKLAIGADTEELSPELKKENSDEKKKKEWKTVKEGGEEETEIRRKEAVYEVKKVQKKGEKKVANLKTTIKDSDERIRNLEDRFQRVIKNVQSVMQE